MHTATDGITETSTETSTGNGTETGTEAGTDARTDGRVRRGDLTRRAVLGRAVDIASIQGLEGLSIGKLAAELDISKSGLFAHFGAKEELQLATIRAARRIYADTVVTPAMAAPPGLERIWAMTEAWLGYSGDRVFPGGCFFAKATHDFAARPGKVRDAVAAANVEWMELVEQTVQEAREAGHLTPETDPALLAFELNALYEGANLISLLRDDDDSAYALARRAVIARLEDAAQPDAPRPWQ